MSLKTRLVLDHLDGLEGFLGVADAQVEGELDDSVPSGFVAVLEA